MCQQCWIIGMCTYLWLWVNICWTLRLCATFGRLTKKHNVCLTPSWYVFLSAPFAVKRVLQSCTKRSCFCNENFRWENRNEQSFLIKTASNRAEIYPKSWLQPQAINNIPLEGKINILAGQACISDKGVNTPIWSCQEYLLFCAENDQSSWKENPCYASSPQSDPIEDDSNCHIQCAAFHTKVEVI